MKNTVVNVTIEIPKLSNVKYEFDRKTGKISVDRILYGPSVYPENYGFIADALDWDGDELDMLIIADQAFNPGIIVPTRIIGAMSMVDGGETDTKLIGVIDCDPRYSHIHSLKDISQHKLAVIKDFFETYKRLQKKSVNVGDFHDVDWAIKELDECRSLMKEYGKIDKDEFIKLMQQKHPEKYQA